MKIIFHRLLWLFLCSFCGAAQAETQWYVVELIVFAQHNRSNETFDQTTSRIEWPGRLEELGATPQPLASLKLAPEAYAPLQNADLGLTAAYQTLQLQGGYQALMHRAWVQPLDVGMENPAVHIQGEKDSGAGAVLNGFMRLGSNGELYLQADLEYVPVAQQGQNTVYRIREKRPIQLGEVHYFDHPMFGVIARVSLLL